LLVATGELIVCHVTAIEMGTWVTLAQVPVLHPGELTGYY